MVIGAALWVSICAAGAPLSTTWPFWNGLHFQSLILSRPSAVAQRG